MERSTSSGVQTRSMTQAFSNRAKKLQTRGSQAKDIQRQATFEAGTQGLTKRQFWQTKVKTKEDVVKFYQLYHPEYPEILVNSIAAKIEEVIYKVRNGIELSEDEVRLFEDKENQAPQTWDPMEDIQKQMLEGKIALASKRLEALLEEEDPAKAKPLN